LSDLRSPVDDPVVTEPEISSELVSFGGAAFLCLLGGENDNVKAIRNLWRV
jgi:hypothetical protein